MEKDHQEYNIGVPRHLWLWNISGKTSRIQLEAKKGNQLFTWLEKEIILGNEKNIIVGSFCFLGSSLTYTKLLSKYKYFFPTVLSTFPLRPFH